MRRSRRETAVDTKRRKRKQASENERWEQSGSRRSVIYHAPRGSPIVSARLLSLSLSLSFSSCRCLSLPTDRSSHPFPSLAHGESSSHGDPVVREPHCDEGPGETRYERPSVPLPPKPPHTLLLNPRVVSRRSLYLLPLRTPHFSLFLPCRSFFFLV